MKICWAYGIRIKHLIRYWIKCFHKCAKTNVNINITENSNWFYLVCNNFWYIKSYSTKSITHHVFADGIVSIEFFYTLLFYFLRVSNSNLRIIRIYVCIYVKEIAKIKPSDTFWVVTMVSKINCNPFYCLLFLNVWFVPTIVC